jgi:hypothetical protein
LLKIRIMATKFKIGDKVKLANDHIMYEIVDITKNKKYILKDEDGNKINNINEIDLVLIK